MSYSVLAVAWKRINRNNHYVLYNVRQRTSNRLRRVVLVHLRRSIRYQSTWLIGMIIVAIILPIHNIVLPPIFLPLLHKLSPLRNYLHRPFILQLLHLIKLIINLLLYQLLYTIFQRDDTSHTRLIRYVQFFSTPLSQFQGGCIQSPSVSPSVASLTTPAYSCWDLHKMWRWAAWSWDI